MKKDNFLITFDAKVIIDRGYSNFWNSMPFFSSSEAKNAYFMSGEATNEITFSLFTR